jgi:galactokinase
MTAAELMQALTHRDAQALARIATAYGSDHAVLASACERLFVALHRYAEAFGDDRAVVVVRAPGRVNLIGEHTDYNGLPVLPMAISRDVLIVAGASDDAMVRATNVDRAFPDRSFALERHIPPFAGGDWGNYLKSATQGLIDYGDRADDLHGVTMAVSGTVPVASGLSSSAAFTIAAALAVLAIHRRSIEPLIFAETMAHSDHYVGMASGGMDQAASVLGQAGKALKIDFHPLRVQPVTLPQDAVIVVCHSRVKAAKAGNARDEYNRRVVECRLATAVLHAGAAKRAKHEPVLLSEWLARDTQGFDDALQQIQARLHAGGYTLAEIAQALRQPADVVAHTLCVTKAGTQYDAPPNGFKLFERARHVISEARRVEQTLALLEAMPADAAAQFGALMNVSHESCRTDYEISCAELDELVMLAREAGALGARLTGAGFGGCTVNLVRAGAARDFMRFINERYYEPRELTAGGDNQFEFAPAAGAGVLFDSPQDAS